MILALQYWGAVSIYRMFETEKAFVSASTVAVCDDLVCGIQANIHYIARSVSICSRSRYSTTLSGAPFALDIGHPFSFILDFCVSKHLDLFCMSHFFTDSLVLKVSLRILYYKAIRCGDTTRLKNLYMHARLRPVDVQTYTVAAQTNIHTHFQKYFKYSKVLLI